MKAAVATTGTGMRGKPAKVIDDGAPLLARLTTPFRKPQKRVIRCEV